ncbi:MAG: monovalent cation/H(+) antiporter subunit G [Oscillospiraceae bacterium]|jgi:multicomponent Na+:H+ antiporter subunit G|nr:monovalent cation/H(+) antiporter subunit G [Oscillospiraceae bacterium]
MQVLQWIRFGTAALLMAAGLFAFVTSVIGIYRFNYVLNRIHVAAKCDTMGIFLTLSSLMVMSGFNVTTLKLLLLIVLMWLVNPVSSHLIAHLEAETNPDVIEECEVIHFDLD